MSLSPLAGKPAPKELLIDVAQLDRAYYQNKPDPSNKTQLVSFAPTPVISHAILTHNRNRKTGLADGIIITPSHNPPADGGFKYNPPNGGPADTDITDAIQNRANELLKSDNAAVRRIPFDGAIQ